MSCFTLLRLLDVCKWILVFKLLFGNWHMLCQKLKSCTPNICSQKRQVYCCYHFHFSCCLFGFVLFCFLSLFSCSLLVYFPLFFVWVSNFFCFYKYVFATIHLYHVHFPCCWVCIVLLFIVAFLFFTCSFPSLLFEFFIFFVSVNIFLQQSICFFNMVTKI